MNMLLWLPYSAIQENNTFFWEYSFNDIPNFMLRPTNLDRCHIPRTTLHISFCKDICLGGQNKSPFGNV